MKYWFLLTWFCLAIVSSQAQLADFQADTAKIFFQNNQIDTIKLMLSPNKFSSEDYQKFKDELAQFETIIKEKRLKKQDDVRFLEWLNWKLHCKYLVNYEEHATVKQTLDEKTYNCVTGTILWAFFLEKLDIEYSIYETNYHVYLMLDLDGKSVLIESTNPKNGVIWEKKQLNEKLANYYEKFVANSKNSQKTTFMGDNPIHRQINLVQLSSLQFFNEAVVHYRKLQFEEAINDLKQANLVYASDRNQELLNLVCRTQKRQRNLPDN